MITGTQVGNIIADRLSGNNGEFLIDGEPHPHAMDKFSGRAHPGFKRAIDRFDIGQSAFYIPQSVGALKSRELQTTSVHQRASDGHRR